MLLLLFMNIFILFTFNNRIYIHEIYLFTFTGVFRIHNYICSHLRDLFTFNPQFVVYPRLTICSLQSTVCSPQSAFYTSTDHLSWLYNMYSVQ